MKIIARRKVWYIFSGVLSLISILVIIFIGFNFGIDFKGGTQIELKFQKSIDINQVRNDLQEFNLKSLSVQKTGDNAVLIKTDELSKDQYAEIRNKLSNDIGPNDELGFETVGPTVSNDLKKKAILAVILASVAIIFYLAFAFRKVQKPASPWRFGVCAVVAIIHDVLIVTGIYVILGHFYSSIVVDSLFITALLTIIGFSVHDTIVVFDRVRENIQKEGGNFDIQAVAERSVRETIVRSLVTSLTAILVLLAILILGGQTIFSFVLALTIGFIFGTYSSIFIATAILVDWTKWSERRKLQRSKS